MDNEKILYELIIDTHVIGNHSFHSFSKAALLQLCLQLLPEVQWKKDEYDDVCGFKEDTDHEIAWINECDFIISPDDITDEYVQEIRDRK
ncbi:MAG: hypothetical protein J7L15_01005 [Clostridiales bacterium]|nr:hypothetical protein [Clostridiales bacterium]